MASSPPPILIGRQHECAVLDQLLTDLREGKPRVRVIRGEAASASLCSWSTQPTRRHE